METVADSAQTLRPQDIPLREILADQNFNCRGAISAFDVRDLIEDIRVRGLQTAVTAEPYVDSLGHKYRLVAGYRRFEAFRALGRETIPTIIKAGMSEADAVVYNLNENIKRQNLNPMQEAKTLQRLKILGYSALEVSKLLSMSYGWVQNRFMLLELPNEIQDEVAAGLLNVTDVRKLAKYSVAQQFEIAKEIKDGRIKGNKKEVKPEVVASKPENQKRARTRTEIDVLQSVVMEVLGASFATRCMAWCQGEISDQDIHNDIRREAKLDGKEYIMPPHLEVQQ